MTGNVALNGGSIRERNNIIWAVSAVVLSGGISAATRMAKQCNTKIFADGAEPEPVEISP